MILHTVNGIEQRQHPRAEIRWPVTIRPSLGTIEGETLNVSSMGAFINCCEPLKFNEVFILDIDVPALDHPLKAIAEVVWSNRDGNKNEITPYGMGIRFIRISCAACRSRSRLRRSYMSVNGLILADSRMVSVHHGHY